MTLPEALARISALECEVNHLREENAGLRKGWQPIAEEPEHGTEAVLCFGDDGPLMIATFHCADGYGWFGDRGQLIEGATHYQTISQPLPEPPAKETN